MCAWHDSLMNAATPAPDEGSQADTVTRVVDETLTATGTRSALGIGLGGITMRARVQKSLVTTYLISLVALSLTVTGCVNTSQSDNSSSSGRIEDLYSSGSRKVLPSAETLIPAEFQPAFRTLTERAQVAMIQLHREGHDELIRKALERNKLNHSHHSGNDYKQLIKRYNDGLSHVITVAYFDSRPEYQDRHPAFLDCLKKFDFKARSIDDLYDKYAPYENYPGENEYEDRGYGVPVTMTDDEFKKSRARVASAASECDRFDPGGRIEAGLKRRVEELRDEYELLDLVDYGRTRRKKHKRPQCLKDANGIVYGMRDEAMHADNALTQAAIRADTQIFKKALKETPNLFVQKENQWILPTLIRYGCADALQVVLKSHLVVIPRKEHSLAEVSRLQNFWRLVGKTVPAATFDTLLKRAFEQSESRRPVTLEIERGIGHYPASFAPILKKYEIGANEETTTYPTRSTSLWMKAVTSAQPEIIESLLQIAGDKKPPQALVYLLETACVQPGESLASRDHERDGEAVRVLRNLGYQLDSTVTFNSAMSSRTVTGLEVIGNRECSAPVRAAARAQRPSSP